MQNGAPSTKAAPPLNAAWVLVLAASPAFTQAQPDTAFLTYEAGALVAVDWIQRRGRQLRSRSVLMQSAIREATIVLRDDGTASSSSTIVWNAGQDPGTPTERTLGEGAMFWSDQIAGSVELAVQRARALGSSTSIIPATSLYRDSRVDVRVQRVDSTDWVVDCNRKRYEVMTDPEGRMLSATLPDYGVIIERRVGFTPATYPLWPPHADDSRPAHTISPSHLRMKPPEERGAQTRPSVATAVPSRRLTTAHARY